MESDIMTCISCDNDFSEYEISQTTYWKIFISEDQELIGRSIIFLKRHCLSLSELTAEEWFDLHHVVKLYESALKKSFNATMFNWSSMMNDAYKHKPYNPHVHWHCRPRYDHEVMFAGEKFVDTDFAHHYKRHTDRKVSADMQNKIIEEIRKNIQ